MIIMATYESETGVPRMSLFTGAHKEWYGFKPLMEAVAYRRKAFDAMTTERPVGTDEEYAPVNGEEPAAIAAKALALRQAQKAWDASNTALYYELITYTRETAQGVVREHASDRNGKAAWNALVTKYEMTGRVEIARGSDPVRVSRPRYHASSHRQSGGAVGVSEATCD